MLRHMAIRRTVAHATTRSTSFRSAAGNVCSLPQRHAPICLTHQHAAGWRRCASSVASTASPPPAAPAASPRGLPWSPSLGVCGFPLRQPQDFAHLEQMIGESITSHLSALCTSSTHLRTLTLVDSLHNALHTGIQACALIRQLHTEADWRDSAKRTESRLISRLADLWRGELKHALASLERADSSLWNDQQRRLLQVLIREARGPTRSDGEPLTETEQARLVELERKATFHAKQFVDGVIENERDQTLYIKLKQAQVEEVLTCLHQHLPPDNLQVSGDELWVPMYDAQTVLEVVPLATARKQTFDQLHLDQPAAGSNAEPSFHAAQTLALAQAVAARASIARLLHHSSYSRAISSSHLTSSSSAAEDAHVHYVLTRILRSLRVDTSSKLYAQVASLKLLKWYRNHEAKGRTMPPLEELTQEQHDASWLVKLRPHDEAFLQAQLLDHMLTFEGHQELRAHFTLDNVMRGCAALCAQIIGGLELRQVAMEDGESWTGGAVTDTTDASPLVTKYELWNTLAFDTPRFVGIIYMDLHWRSDKAIDRNDGECIVVRRACSDFDGHPQHGAVALVANLASYTRLEGKAPEAPRSSRSKLSKRQSRVPKQIIVATLSQAEVAQIFRQFGQALSLLLNDARYHALAPSGTARTPEQLLPGQMVERFLSEPGFVLHWARHGLTGEPLPASLWHATQQAQATTSHTKLVAEAVESLLDRQIHGADLMNTASHDETGERVDGAWRRLHLKHSAFYEHEDSDESDLTPSDSDAPQPKPFLRDTSLLQHGGTRYATLYSRILTDMLWRRHFDVGPSEDARAVFRTLLVDAPAALPAVFDLRPDRCLHQLVETQLPAVIASWQSTQTREEEGGSESQDQ